MSSNVFLIFMLVSILIDLSNDINFRSNHKHVIDIINYVKSISEIIIQHAKVLHHF